MKETKLLRPALVLTSGRALAFAASFFIPVVLTRVLDPAEFGTYKQVFLIYTTVYLMAQMGMAESLFYFVPLDARKAGTFVANATIVLGVAGLAAGAAIVGASGWIRGWFVNPSLAECLPLLGLFIALTMSSAALEIVLTSRGRFTGAASAYFLSDAVKAVCFVVPALLATGLVGILTGAVLFATLRLTSLVIYRREFGSALRPDLSSLKGQFAYTLPMGIYVLVEIAQANLHQYAVSARVDAAVFAIYAVGCLQIPLVEFLASPSCNVMMVGMRERLQAGEPGAALSLWREMTGKLALMIIPVVALLLLAGGDLIRVLFTERFAASVPIFLLWTCSLLFAVLQTDGVLRVFAETRFLLLVGIIKLVLIASSVGWFLTTFGLPGPVILTLLATMAGKSISLMRIKRLLHASAAGILPWSPIVQGCALSAAAAIPAALLRARLDLPPFSLLLSTGAVFSACYASLILLSRARRPQLLRMMPEWLFR